MNGPREPRADIRMTASACYEMFIALVQEGFTEAQALTIVGNMLAIAATLGDEGKKG